MFRLSWPYRVFSVMVVLALVVGCGVGCNAPAATPAAPSKLNITVSIVPQKYFVERVGGEYVEASVMVMPGASPATYEPKPEQLTALSKAAAFVSIGVPFESAWMERIKSANSKLLIVDTTQGLDRIPKDPHIWLSPKLVKIQAQTIADALVKLDPAHQAAFEANLKKFHADIDALDGDIRKTLENTKSKKFIVFHPAWGYFARDYGLEQIPIEVGGQEPSAAELGKVVSTAKTGNIKVVLAQPEFSARDAETIAKEIGGQVLPISPLAPNWLDNMRAVAKTFADVLGK